MSSPRQEALDTGATRYHGRPCVRCGGTERRTVNGECMACRTVRQRKYFRERRKADKAKGICIDCRKRPTAFEQSTCWRCQIKRETRGRNYE